MRVFVDTGALLALSHVRDQYHRQAKSVAKRHRGSGVRYVSSTLVLTEFHTHVLYLRGPAAALDAMTRLVEDPAHQWQPVSVDLIRTARSKWLARFMDQRLSLTDAVSFEIMTRESLTHAFTFDRHFDVAGFTRLA